MNAFLRWNDDVLGKQYVVHSMLDDHSHIVYSEVLDTEDGPTYAGFMLRAARWFATSEYHIDRVMIDNALVYRRSQAFADALSLIGTSHKLIRPYRP